MILAVDIGNSNIVVGCIDSEKTYFVERLSTDRAKTDLEYAINLKIILDMYHISPEDLEGGIISSVVPPISSVVKRSVEKILKKEALLVGPGIKTGLNIKIDNPGQLGSDLVVDAVAAIYEYPTPLIVIDMGTATTMSAIDKAGQYLGGAIIPGLRVSLDSLTTRTSQLPRVSLEAPRHAIGKNTIECMKSGAILGNAALLDGMIDRFQEELGGDATVVATGGLIPFIAPHCRHRILCDDKLLLKGLWILYQKNQKPAL